MSAFKDAAVHKMIGQRNKGGKQALLVQNFFPAKNLLQSKASQIGHKILFFTY